MTDRAPSISLDVRVADDGGERVRIVRANATSLWDSTGARWARKTGKCYGYQRRLSASGLAKVERVIAEQSGEGSGE